MEAAPRTVEELTSLRVKDMRRYMEAAGMNVAGCFDKESLLDLLDAEGGADRWLQATESQVDEVPLRVADDYMAIDIALGKKGTVGRFVIDTCSPYTMISPGWSTALGGVIVPGSPNGERGFGPSKIGKLSIGDFQAVAVTTDLPPDCCGILSLDFLRKFDWDFDVPAERVRISTVPPALGADAPLPFDLEGLSRASLKYQSVRMRQKDLNLLMAEVHVRRQWVWMDYPSEALKMSLPKETYDWWFPKNKKKKLRASSIDPSEEVIPFAVLLDSGKGSLSTLDQAMLEPLRLRESVDIFDGDTLVKVGSREPRRMQSAIVGVEFGREGDTTRESQVVKATVVLDHPYLRDRKVQGILGLDALRKTRFVLSQRKAVLYMKGV